MMSRSYLEKLIHHFILCAAVMQDKFLRNLTDKQVSLAPLVATVQTFRITYVAYVLSRSSYMNFLFHKRLDKRRFSSF